MPFSAAVAKKLLGNRRRLENFNFFLSVGGGGWKIFGSRRRRLQIFENILKKFLRFEKFCIKKGKNDNCEPAHKELDEKNSGNGS